MYVVSALAGHSNIDFPLDAQLYGFDGKGGRETRNGQKTYFRNQTLNWPPLNIKAFYLPNNFYWNWTYLTDVASSTTLGTYEDISASAFIVEDEIYNLKDVQAGGVCQPIKSGVCLYRQ